MRVNLVGLCAAALVTPSRWQMRFSADAGSVRRARVGQQPSQPCLAMTLFDLSKAFDLLVRADAWKAVGRLAQDASIEFFLEELHRGVYYILKDKHTGQLRKRILTDMGVRQGSVEGSACFLTLYDIATWEVKTAGDRTAITAQQQGISTEVNVSDLKFMDDLVSFFEFRDLDTLQRFIENVTAVFTQHSFQVNVGKLEVCAVVAGPGTQARVAQLKRGHLRIHPQRRSRMPSRVGP